MALMDCDPPTGTGPSIVLTQTGVPTRTDLPVGTQITDGSTGVAYVWTAGSVWAPQASIPGGTSGQVQYNNGGIFGGFTASGDATINTSTGAVTIANDAVTYAKMQNVSATSRVLGRKTAGAGDPEELTLSDVLDLIGSAAQGDILFRGASSWSRLAAGTSGDVLQTNGAGADPTWVPAAAGSSTSGSWTPTLSFATGSTGITYSKQVGRYVKTDKSVTVAMYILLTSKGSSTGLATISGLPFNSANVTDLNQFSGIQWGFSTLTGWGMFITPNSTSGGLLSATGTQITNTNFSNTSELAASFTYVAN